MSKDVLSVVEKYMLCVIFFHPNKLVVQTSRFLTVMTEERATWRRWRREELRNESLSSVFVNPTPNHLTSHYRGSFPLKKKKKWLKHFFPAVCKSALNVASIRRASPSLQQAAGAAASICCGNEDGTEAKGKGYRQVGEEGKKNRWSAQERRSELEVEYWKEVIISKLICRTVSQAQHPQKKWVFKAAVIGPFKHTELLGAAGVGRALTNAQTVHWHNECKRNVRLIWGL